MVKPKLIEQMAFMITGRLSGKGWTGEAPGEIIATFIVDEWDNASLVAVRKFLARIRILEW